jgi:hypothetical protein
VLIALGACQAASAATTTGKSAFPTLTNIPTTQDTPPKGYRLTALGAINVAKRDPKIRAELRKHPRLNPAAYTESGERWQVSFFQGSKEMAQATVQDRFGAVTESWTGYQVAWRMARGYPGAFGRGFNSIYVWLPLGLLFLAPFIDPRRPFRLLHLDLLVLVGFVVSHLFFEQGNIGVSVPLVYPVLAYIFVRMLVAGFRQKRARPPSGKLVPYAPIWLLAIALVGLLGFRVALNMVNSNAVDVGYSGVIGADHIVHGQPLYSNNFPADNDHGDTYGPVDYLVYVPFERIWPWTGTWNDLPAAHAAAIAFDLLTLLGLFLLGRRLRAGPAGRDLGVILAYAWVAYPYTLFALASNTNDTMVAMFAVYALLAIASPLGRGVLTGLGAAAKFVTLALGPLFARGTGKLFSRGTLEAGLAILAVVIVAFVPFLGPGIKQVWHRTLDYQITRPSPFSVWGQASSLAWLHTLIKVIAVGLAVIVAFIPRRRDPVTVAALGAAVLVGFQLAAGHWFYLYIVWFAPFALVALFAPYVPTAAEPEAGSAQSNGLARLRPPRSPRPSPTDPRQTSRT